MAEGFRHVDAGGCLIALISRHYLEKQHCLKEARYPLICDAANCQERLIVLRLDNCEPPDLLKDIRYIDIGQHLNHSAELAEVVGGAVRRSLAKRAVTLPMKSTDPKIEQIMLFLENEDHVNHGKGLLSVAGLFFAIGTLMIAFDYALSAWNWTFETGYYAIFPTDEVITMWFILAVLLGFGLFWQIHDMSRTIENARLSPSQLRALRTRIAEHAWRNQWLVDAAISTATRRITSAR